MKATQSLVLSVEALDLLRAKAKEGGMSLSATADAAILAALGQGATTPIPRATRQPTKWEGAVLDALDRLTDRFADPSPESRDMLCKGHGSFPLSFIAKTSGLYPSQVMQALRALEKKDLVLCEVLPNPLEELTSTGRLPTVANVEQWWRAPEGWKRPKTSAAALAKIKAAASVRDTQREMGVPEAQLPNLPEAKPRAAPKAVAPAGPTTPEVIEARAEKAKAELAALRASGVCVSCRTAPAVLGGLCRECDF